MWILYQAATLGALLLAAPFLLARRWGHYLPTLRARLGRSTLPQRRHDLWIHAVSVGEVEVAKTLLAALRTVQPPVATLVTTVTPTGQARARRSMPDDVRVSYLPFEIGFAQRRFLRRNAPRSLVLVEGELWPLLMRNLRRRGAPIVLVNGRISDRSFARLRRLRAVLGPLTRPVAHFGVQTGADRDRLLDLGVEPKRVTVTGNVKFDADEPPQLEGLRDLLTAAGGQRPLLVAGSTMPGEEELVLDAIASIRDLDVLLLLAPRHPERFDRVAELCRSRGLRTVRRTELDEHADPPADGDPAEVLLLDSLGELASTYRWCRGAFVGGTLVPTGGHNPIEPARCGAAVCVGPSMENFREIAEHFEKAGAWHRVASAEELAAVWRRWIEEPSTAEELAGRARGLVECNRGAARRSVELLAEHLPFLGIDRDERP